MKNYSCRLLKNLRGKGREESTQRRTYEYVEAKRSSATPDCVKSLRNPSTSSGRADKYLNLIIPLPLVVSPSNHERCFHTV
jgi:hypothetical protein